MSKIVVLSLFFLLYKFAISSSTFDQRQTGDVNVQVDLKNVQIIALMKSKEDYVDYDYAYDYSEMTIKPPNGTTKNPLNLTTIFAETRDNETAATTVFTEQATEIINRINNTLVTTDKYEATLNPTANESSTRGDLDVSTAIVTPDALSNKNMTTSSTSDNNCKKGFVRNNKGNCEYKLQNTSNALLKILKLSQKLKLRRENRKNEDSV